MKLLLLAAAATLAMAASASADVTTSGSYSGASTQFGSTVDYTSNPVTGVRSNTLVQGSSLVSGDKVTFSDGAVAASSGSSANLETATSTTTISQTVTNTTGSAQQVNFASVLSNGSFGMFASTPCESNTQTSCNAYGGQAFGLSKSGTATSGFNVDVTVNGAAVYSLSGDLVLKNGVLTADVTAADSFLNNFTSIEVDDRAGVRQKFFVWDDTDLDVALGRLNAGSSFDVAYNLTTFSTTSVDLAQGAGQIDYSAFGDPIGVGHVINAIRIPTFALATPDISFAPVVSGAPEPQSWMLMILGIGLAGAMLRTRRRRSDLGAGSAPAPSPQAI